MAKRKIVDLSDLENDPIVMGQKRFYILLFALIAIAMPVLVRIITFFFSLSSLFILNFCLCALAICFILSELMRMQTGHVFFWSTI